MNLLFLPFLFLTILTSLNPQDIILPNPLPSCKGFTITGSPTQLGVSVDGGGDINDDQIPDIIISDYRYPSLSTVYVIYGTKNGYSDIDVTTMSSEQGFKITGVFLYAGDNMNQLSISGDVDGDGINDIVIGAAGTNGAQGVVYVIYGKKGGYTDFSVSSLTPDKGYTIIGSEGRVGWNINTKLDVNGDKINDILIGANTAGPNLSEGAAFVVYGQKSRGPDLTLATMPPARGFRISGYVGSYTGAAVGSAGDFNQDNIDDLIIGSPGASSFIGNSYVVYGKKGTIADFSISAMTPTEGFTLTGQSPYGKLAIAASDAGDFNNDGVSDILLSGWNGIPTIGSYALILYGKKGGPPNLPTSAITSSDGFRIDAVTITDQLGSSLSSISDINGDGISDVLIGATGYSSNLGALYVIFGREDQPSTIDLSTFTQDEGIKIVGNLAGGMLGFSVRSLGDINQDGVPDMIVTAAAQKHAYVLFGQNVWSCDTCSSASTCSKCQTGYNYTYNGGCYRKCPVFAPYIIGSQCSATPESVIPVTLKESLIKSADAITAANKITNLWSPLSALPFIYGQLKTSIIYMKYLNISRTQKLEELYQIYADTDSSAVPFITMKSSTKDAFPVQPLPYMFEKYELPSSFIANFGDDLMGLVAVLGLLMTIELACFLLKKWHHKKLEIIRKILERVSVICQNFLPGSFGESVGPIILFMTFEFRHVSRGKDYYPLSPIVCCFSLILGLAPILVCVLILRKFENIRLKKSKQQEEEFELLAKKYECVGVLFDEFENSSFFKQSAFLVFTLKSMAESLVIGLLFEYPLTQAVFLLLLTGTLLAYALIKRPFESKISLVQQSVLIFAIFICNLCLVIMAATDVALSNFQDTLESTSQRIFLTLVIFQFVPLVFFAVDLIQGARKFYKWYSTFRSKKEVQRIPTKEIAQIHSSSSSTYQSVLSINNSRTNLPEPILIHQTSKNPPLMLSFEAESISPSKKLDLSNLPRAEKALQRVSLRERVRLTNISQKSKESVD